MFISSYAKNYLQSYIFYLFCLFFLFIFNNSQAQDTNKTYLLKADRVFDGEEMHESWVVAVQGNKIIYTGAASGYKAKKGTEEITLTGTTLLPGMIEGHSHLFLHPYDEVSWNDQVLKESFAERVARATVHAKNTLDAGFTTVRDLGSEGADYIDAGLKTAIEKGIIPGPRMIIATKAIVATGSYGPKGFHPYVDVPLGAEEANGYDNIIKVVRDQIGKGADVIKVYADYRWGANGEAMPTFLEEEMALMVKVANSSGRDVVAHASTAEGMRRAIMAGVKTIEHGDGGTKEVFELMKEKGVAFCPTLAAGDAIQQYRGWKKGTDPDPERIVNKKKTFKLALDAGVTIVAGGDVGVFTHGDNARELEMMVEYGMDEKEVLKSVTSVNANVFGLEKLGHLKSEMLADIIAVEGNPIDDISTLRKIKFVMKDGDIYKK
ncbi:metal-dependent hydrolase family protein [Chondrinema litorale]|uniref:metal-dependent hydrolase family protein n=1 Tax=Chondrinema litorale TaxID=2994555 RepID=UPI002542E968|nr:amidohydrolase family protein [Chondrinema litorale]UZR94712.1 amidohydrolase family protein [Chondrinema litorale]